MNVFNAQRLNATEKLIAATKQTNLYKAKEALAEGADVFKQEDLEPTSNKAPACAFWIALKQNWVQGVRLFAEAVSEADRERMLFQAIEALCVLSTPSDVANVRLMDTHLPCVYALLDFPVNPNCRKRGITPLHALMRQSSCSIDCVSALLKAGADSNAVDDDGNTPIFYIPSIRPPAWKVVDLLKKHGANMNHRNKKGQTILHTTENTDVYDAAIYHGADPTIADNDGNLPKRPAYKNGCCVQ